VHGEADPGKPGGEAEDLPGGDESGGAEEEADSSAPGSEAEETGGHDENVSPSEEASQPDSSPTSEGGDSPDGDKEETHSDGNEEQDLD
jgi:hypothetical protein